MLIRYEKFLEKLDKRLEKYFEEQCEHIKCKSAAPPVVKWENIPFQDLSWNI